MRLIDADKAREEAAIDLVVHLLDRQPTIEAKPVVHAHWKGGIVTSLHCSNCGETALGTCFEEEFMSNYCPYCGAQMDELVSNTDELNSSEKIPVISMEDVPKLAKEMEK